MNELPGGKFRYKLTRPLLHHNCLYSYSHSSRSTRCTWKWFVLRKNKKKKGLVALHLLSWNKEKGVLGLPVEKLTSWEVTHYPSLGNLFFLLWSILCLFHIIKNVYWKHEHNSLIQKTIIIQVAEVFHLEVNVLSMKKYWMRLSTVKFLTHCMFEQPSIEDQHFTSAEDSSPTPAVIFQRHNLRTFDYLHFRMCLSFC